MRPSNRTQVLDAAISLAQRDGVTAVTLDSVASEAGLTKGGLMYHFPSRTALLQGVQEHLALTWDSLLVAAAGKEAAEATAEEKLTAYARVATQSASSADLAFILEFAKHSEAGDLWRNVADKWTPSPQEARSDPRLFALFIARLAADGLWTFESLINTRLDDEFRHEVAEAIAGIITAPCPADGNGGRE